MSRPEDRPRALALLERARSTGELRADVLLLQDQPVTADWWFPLGGTVVRTVASPAVRFPDGGWGAYEASKSKNMRSQMRRRENGLRRDHDVQTRVSTPDRLDEDLETFWQLHVQRWGESAEFARGSVRAFTDDFCHVAIARDWLRLRVLEVDGTPQAVQMNLRYGSSESLYQAGRNPDLDGSSVGFVLTTDTLRSVCEEGLSEFRFLRGNDAYKYRFANVSRDVHSVAVPLTRRGRLAVALASRRRDESEFAPIDLPPHP
ncbi:GNAT family N-acetyltransferase [Janibacter alittae]|uniref:GNAT family N-acetyltransferase n=1 Tax=Janibacter alittae TaxID=3115209 RepID=A0ABZ2MGB3_9MICO